MELATCRSASLGSLFVLACAGFGSSGCFLSHGRPGDADGGGVVSRDAGTRDAGPRPDGARTLPDSGVEARCEGRWISSGPVALTEEPGDESILDAEWVGEGYLVGWMSSNEAGDRARYGRLTFPSHGVLAETARIFDAPAPVSGGMGIAVWRDQIGAAAWDERGCAFRRILSADASSLGSVVRYPTPRVGRCEGLIADAAGYSFVNRAFSAPSAGELTRVQPSGTLEAGRPLPIFDGDVSWWGRAVLGENVLLFATMRGGAAPSEAFAQRVDATGAPLGPVVPLPAFGAASRVALVGTPTGALVGWLESPDGDPDSQEREVRVFPTDSVGSALGPPLALPGVRAYRDAGWSMTRIGDEIFVVYVEPEVGDRSGERTTLKAARVRWDGAPIGEPLWLAEGRFLRHPVARTSGTEVLVAYTAFAGVSHEVFVAELGCDIEL